VSDHPRLAALYVIATQCYMAGRPEAAIRYSDAGQTVVGSSHKEAFYGIQGCLGGAYTYMGQSDRAVEWCRAEVERGRDTHTLTRAALVLSLTISGSSVEAAAAANGLVDAAEATGNPFVISYALFVYGFAHRDTNPVRALDALRRGLAIAQDSGNRLNESGLASTLGRLEAKYGDPLAALDYFALAMRNYHDSGNTTTIHVPLAVLAVFFDRLGRHEPAAMIAGFTFNPLTVAWIPKIAATIAHLREVLGGTTYESLAHSGAAMTTSAMVTYAYDQIDQARAALNAVS
jgi:hypothetical protein